MSSSGIGHRGTSTPHSLIELNIRAKLWQGRAKKTGKNLDDSCSALLPLLRLWNVPVELEALRVGEGALVLDRLAHQNLLHGDLHLLG